MDRAYIKLTSNLLVAAAVFLVLFIIFLVKSIKRGRRIRELENRIKELELSANVAMYPLMPADMPQYTPYPYQPAVPVQTPVYQPVSVPSMNAAVPASAVIPEAALKNLLLPLLIHLHLISQSVKNSSAASTLLSESVFYSLR